MIVVGSTAAKHHFPEYRTPKDLDVWVASEDEDLSGCDVTFVTRDIISAVPLVDGYPSPDALYTIKLAHLTQPNPLWAKHKRDALWLQSKGCCVVPELYILLCEYWETEKNFLSLNKTKDEFFDDFVNYIYPHDLLHSLIAYPEEPLYKKILKDGHEVLVCKDKFDSLSAGEQVQLFREEMLVIAFERWVIPTKGKISIVEAWPKAVEKTITTLTKGWASRFIVDNLSRYTMPSPNNYRHLEKELNMRNNTVNMEPFENLLEMQSDVADMDYLVFLLAIGDIFFDDGTILPPDANGREFSDPSYKEEREAHRLRLQAEHAAIKESIGYQHLQEEGGGEGGSEYCFGVFKLGDKVYRAVYSYYSHHGYEYDGIVHTLKEVKPVQKTITVYE